MTSTSDLERRQIGWVMHDRANSAFHTTVVTVLAGRYLAALAQQAAFTRRRPRAAPASAPVGSAIARSLTETRSTLAHLIAAAIVILGLTDAHEAVRQAERQTI